MLHPVAQNLLLSEQVDHDGSGGVRRPAPLLPTLHSDDFLFQKLGKACLTQFENVMANALDLARGQNPMGLGTLGPASLAFKRRQHEFFSPNHCQAGWRGLCYAGLNFILQAGKLIGIVPQVFQGLGAEIKLNLALRLGNIN